MQHEQVPENNPQPKLREKQTSNMIYSSNIDLVSPVALETTAGKWSTKA